MASARAIGPCLWFDDQAEEAARFYTGIFKNSKIGKYGVSWQVVPALLKELVGDPDSEISERAMEAMLEMKKIDVTKLERLRSPARVGS